MRATVRSAQLRVVDWLTLGRARVNAPALLAVLVWGAVYPFAKYALAEFPVMAYTALRPLLAAALLFGLVRLRGERASIARGDWPRLLAAGLCGMAVFQIFFISGLRRTSASHSALLSATSPLIAGVLLWGARRWSPDRRSVLGLLLGFLGVTFLVRGSAGDTGVTLAGDLMTLLAAVGWVGVTTIPVPLVARYGALRVTAWMVLLSGVAAVPLGAPDILVRHQSGS